MVGYDFHPEARLDLDEIWESIGVDSLAAADRLVAEIFNAVRPWCHFRTKVTSAWTLARALFALLTFANI